MSFIDWILEISLVKSFVYLGIGLTVYSFVVNFFIQRKAIKNFKKKHVLITGGSAGLGFALAIQLAKEGAKITIIARNKDKLSQAQEEIKKVSQENVVAISADVSSWKDTDRAIKEAIQQQGGVDVLVANAGASYPNYFLDTAVDIYEREVQLNYLGTLYAIKSALPNMVERDSGHIVIVSSAVAYNSFIGYSNYGATKYALKGLADALRNELQLYNIGVSIFCPANIDTEGFKEEQKTKPKETKEIEGAASTQTPDQTATYLVNGLRSGTYNITNEFFPSGVMSSVANPVFAPRTNLLLDIFLVPVLVVLSPVFTIIYDGIVQASRTARKKAGTKKSQ